MIKTIRCLLLTFLLGYSITLWSQSLHRVNFSVSQSWEGKQALLVVKPLNQFPIIDTTSIIDNHAVFEVNLNEPSPAYIWLESMEDDIHFFLDSPSINVHFDSSSLTKILITGSPDTQLWKRQDSLLLLQDKLLSAIANPQIDSIEFNQLTTVSKNDFKKTKYRQIEDSVKIASHLLIIKLINENPKSSASWYLFRNTLILMSYFEIDKLLHKLSFFRNLSSYREIRKMLKP